MIASPIHRFVFLHVPKSAGTSIRIAIKEAFSRDASLIEGWGIEDGVDLAHLLPPCLGKRYPMVYDLLGEEGTRSIAVIRDPLSRVLSAYREHCFQYSDHPSGCATLSDYLDRIEEGCYRSGGDDAHVFIHGAPQHEFLVDRKRLLVRHLLRLDDPLLFPKLCLAVGVILPKLDLANASGAVPGYVNRSDVRRILEIYGKDYEVMESVSVGTESTATGAAEQSMRSGLPH